MRRIAITSEAMGYDGLLIPTGGSCHVPWVTAASVVVVTSRIKRLVALRTSTSGPTAFARQTATPDQALGGRLPINVVPGGDLREFTVEGVFFGHDERYENAHEFMTVWRKQMQDETVDFRGKLIRVEGARNFHPAVQKPYPHLEEPFDLPNWCPR